jgi:hypothetical protein
MRLCILHSRRFVDPGPIADVKLGLDRIPARSIRRELLFFFYFSVGLHAGVEELYNGWIYVWRRQESNTDALVPIRNVFLLDYSSWTLSMLIPNHRVGRTKADFTDGRIRIMTEEIEEDHYFLS